MKWLSLGVIVRDKTMILKKSWLKDRLLGKINLHLENLIVVAKCFSVHRRLILNKESVVKIL
jgi:hypothetical protein